jgi:lipopolysaccharide export system permease protein
MKYVKTLDLYITKKFLGTFFFALILIILIVLVFDLGENLDDYLAADVSFKSVAVGYYSNFIPYFANLYSGLFTFIAVIYFTSKLAYNTEIIAILSSGVSYWRFLAPYVFSALIIASLSFVLGNYIIPPANKKRIDFRDTYIKKNLARENQIHRQIEPGVYIYIQRFLTNDVGEKFALEKFEGKNMTVKILADNIRWDEATQKWILNQYWKRTIKDGHEEVVTGYRLDTTLNMKPEEYRIVTNETETMTTPAIKTHIASLRSKGVNPVEFELERHKRTSDPFSVFIFTLIGAGLASRKIKGGLGLHLGLGILFSFSFIFFSQISRVFAISGNMSPFMAVWIPSLIFGIIAVIILHWASR